MIIIVIIPQYTKKLLTIQGLQLFNHLPSAPFLILGQFHLLPYLGPRNRCVVVIIHTNVVLVPL